MSYGCPVWSNVASLYMRKLNVLQNKILKCILHLPRRTPTALLGAIPRFERFIEDYKLNFMNNCSISKYETIRNISHSFL